MTQNQNRKQTVNFQLVQLQNLTKHAIYKWAVCVSKFGSNTIASSLHLKFLQVTNMHVNKKSWFSSTHVAWGQWVV